MRLRRADISLKKASSIAHDIVAGLMEWQQENKGADLPMVYVVFADDGVRIDIDEDKNKEVVFRLDTFTIASNVAGRIDEMKN